MSGEEYKKWVNEAYLYISKKEVYDRVDQIVNANVGSTQYIPKTDGDIEFVFLGHDAHEGRASGEKLDITNAKNRFFTGNGDPKCWRKLKEWKIWNNIESAFRNVGFNEIMDNGYISDEILKKTIVTNALLFTYGGYAKELNAHLKQDIVNGCMRLTGKLIFDVIKPKMVICSSCPLVFEPLIKNYDANIRYEVFSLGNRKRVMRYVDKVNDITILGIPHTSYPVPLTVAAFIRDSYLGKDIGHTMSNISYAPSINPMHLRAKELQKMISKNGAKQSIYYNVLYHEYYSTKVDGNYASSKDNIVIDLTPEEDKKRYVVLVFTRQNNEEKTKELIKGIWPNEEFNPWECDKSRHVHEVISFEVSNEEIKNQMEKVIDEVKAYRDKEYPLNK
jgi:hypothetical protein